MYKKLVILFTLIFQFSILANSQYQTSVNKKGPGYFTNPIFAGDYPDPSILRDDDIYYIVNSSFEYYPGLTIWKSSDLINWTPVVNTLYKYVGSVWAPDLVKHKNKYYIYFPANNTNYVIWADSINGKWSEPVDLKFGHIDPGHFTDAQGKRYLYFSSGGYVPLTDDGLAVNGEYKHVYGGWPIPREWSIECFCLEGPKIAKRGEYYYLTVAEGGTAGPATSHMIISARSKSPLGPWENSPYNPVLRTLSSEERWWSQGHGTLFDDANGDWWMLFHAYEKGFYNMGRQTLLHPVEWTSDGWFKISDAVKKSQYAKRPKKTVTTTTPAFTLNDNFEGKELKPHWKFFGEFDTSRFQLANGKLVIKAKGNTISNSSPLLCIPSHHSYTAEVELVLEGKATGGLVLFYNENASSGILAENDNILANIKGWQFPTEKNVIKNHAFLLLKKVNNTVDMYYSTDGKNWFKIENSLEVSGLHHNTLGGFLSLRIGLCAIGEGSVTFKNFKYRSLE